MPMESASNFDRGGSGPTEDFPAGQGQVERRITVMPEERGDGGRAPRFRLVGWEEVLRSRGLWFCRTIQIEADIEVRKEGAREDLLIRYTIPTPAARLQFHRHSRQLQLNAAGAHPAFVRRRGNYR